MNINIKICNAIFLLLFASCTSQTIQRTEQNAGSIESLHKDSTVKRFQPQLEDLTYHPVILPGFFESRTPLIAEPWVVELKNPENISDESETVSMIVDGFRVQVYSGKDRSVARIIESKLKKNYDLNVYFLYEAPFYKVRIGNFENRNSAARFGMDMRKNGYRDAWVVKSRVTIN